MGSKRGRSSYDHTYHLQKIQINKKGLKAVLEIMELYDLSYDCSLYSVTKYIENFYPRNKETSLMGLEYTNEVVHILDYIKENELLGRK